METIGQRIARQRLTKRWTQEKLASELGITQSILSDIENDKVSPKWDTITAVADKLDVAVASLLPNADSNILYQPEMKDNAVGFINHYSSQEERKLWEALLKSKEDLIESQKMLIEMLQAQLQQIKTNS
jgi:transcriptional regulator with XRE-family HTH domain